MEKFFSVTVELKDGTSKVLPISGDSPSAVFQRAKERPDIRRVGRVSEVDLHEWDALHGRGGETAASRAARRAAERPTESAPAPGRTSLEQPLRGPRVISHARPTGGEQPFKHLKAPPERPKPPKVEKPAVSKPAQVVVPVAPVAPDVVPADDGPAAKGVPGGVEYRIIKSRRQTGEPYLLQRGQWHEQKGKRVFSADWEKGFAEREQAEKHQEWVERNAREMAEANEGD